MKPVGLENPRGRRTPPSPIYALRRRIDTISKYVTPLDWSNLLTVRIRRPRLRSPEMPWPTRGEIFGFGLDGAKERAGQVFGLVNGEGWLWFDGMEARFRVCVGSGLVSAWFEWR